MNASACLIANPAAGRGRGGCLLPAIREALLGRGVADIRLTNYAGEERLLARAAANEGVATIIALGGDGTWGNAAAGILESGRAARLALLVAGTGNDFSYALRLPVRDERRMLDIATGPRTALVDAGSVGDRYFLNVAGFGVETSVLEAIGRIPLLRGPLLYLAAAVPKLATYRAMSLRVGDDAPAPFLAIVGANGPRFGGGFRIAPQSSVTDGLLDIVLVRDAPRLRRASLLARVRLGSHLAEPEVELRRVSQLDLAFTDPPLMDVDGELVAAPSASVQIRCLKQVLSVAIGDDCPA